MTQEFLLRLRSMLQDYLDEHYAPFEHAKWFTDKELNEAREKCVAIHDVMELVLDDIIKGDK